MSNQEIMHYWYYFCSICQQLEATRQYIDHRTVEHDGQLVFENGSAYSNAFLQILLLASSEFETVGKLLCKEIEPGYSDRSNILEISETILSHFPQIGQTCIQSDFFIFRPLEKWLITKNEKGNQHVEGLKWWDGYCNIKHKRYDFFKEANLENCIFATASLLVLELYLSMVLSGNVSNLSSHACPYYYFQYGHEQYWVRCSQNLPDFSDQ